MTISTRSRATVIPKRLARTACSSLLDETVVVKTSLPSVTVKVRSKRLLRPAVQAMTPISLQSGGITQLQES